MSYRYRTTLFPILLTTLLSSQAYARGEITTVTTMLQGAIPSNYTLGDQLYEWGEGEDLILKSIQLGDKSIEYNKFTPDRVVVRRVTNSRASGRPCAVFAATMGSDYRFQPTYPDQPLAGDGTADLTEEGNCDYGKLVSSNRLNIGSLDLFANAERDYSIKNIERVDLIFSNGLITPTAGLDESGHVVIEKSGNNHVQIAAITALNDKGEPSSYGPLIMVRPHDYQDDSEIRYGIAYEAQRFAFLSNKNKAPQGYLQYRRNRTETLGMAFVSVADLGLGAEQKYYGISLFGADVDPDLHTLTDPTTFPLDTGFETPVTLPSGVPAQNAGDADIIVGTAGDFTLVTASGETTTTPPTDVAGSSETKDVVDIVDTPAPSSNSGGSGGGSIGAGLATLLPLLWRQRRRPRRRG